MTATRPAPSLRRSSARAARALALAAAAAATTIAGVYIAGGRITDDFRAAMGLTAAWFLIAAATALTSLKAGRSTGIPILTGYLIAATATGGYLAATTLRDKTVHETVATGPTEARGAFRDGEHATHGTARVIRLPDGRRVLTLTDFSTAAGPDLRVRIGDVDLGGLKGNRGDQQYDLPDDLNPRDHTVLIWCRAFSALFGSAQLRKA